MEDVLVVSSADKAKTFFVELLETNGGATVRIADSGSEARRMMISGEFGLVVINAPLTDEFGQDLAVGICENATAGVILVVKAEMADGIAEKVEDAGVLVVPRPVSRQFFWAAVKLAAATGRRLENLRHENKKLQNKIEEIRFVDRAKCVLIQYLNMTEPQAHRYIEKQAMDMRVTRREIAEGILKTYQL